MARINPLYRILYVLCALVSGYSAFRRLRQFAAHNTRFCASWYKDIQLGLSPASGTEFTVCFVYLISLHNNPTEYTFYRWSIYATRTHVPITDIKRELAEEFDKHCLYDLNYSAGTYDILLDNVDVCAGYAHNSNHIMIGGASISIYRLFDDCSMKMVTEPWRIIYKRLRSLNV